MRASSAASDRTLNCSSATASSSLALRRRFDTSNILRSTRYRAISHKVALRPGTLPVNAPRLRKGTAGFSLCVTWRSAPSQIREPDYEEGIFAGRDLVMRVLVVDDEPAVRQALERALRFEGYTAELAEDGMAGLAAHAERPADAIVLDIAMPRLDGLEMCRRLRAAGDRTPVLMLTAKAAVTERVDGLDAGADDYLVKPFALEELLARLRALLRRSAPTAENEILRFGDLSLDPGTREVRRGNRLIELTRTEFLLLELFLRNPKQVLPREVIFDRVWGYDFGLNSNSLEVYIGYLRRKTEAGGEPRLIHTVRGVGYVMRLPTEMRG